MDGGGDEGSDRYGHVQYLSGSRVASMYGLAASGAGLFVMRYLPATAFTALRDRLHSTPNGEDDDDDDSDNEEDDNEEDDDDNEQEQGSE